MRKDEFLQQLKEHLAGLPEADIRRLLDDFSEGIADRMEDGMTEEAAVAAMGNMDQIVAQIFADTPLPQLVKARMTHRRRLSGWAIALLIIGAPLWLPLLITAGVLMLAVQILLWVLVLVLYIVDLVLGLSGLILLYAAGNYFAQGNITGGLLSVGSALVVAGLTVLLFIGCCYTAKGVWWLCKTMLLGIKRSMIRKR